MGVYVPPPDDNDPKKNQNQKDSTSPTSNSSNSSSTDSSSSASGSNTIIIPNPVTLIPRNPSVGLIWGPLIPASDNRPALYATTGLQFLLGVAMFRHARSLLRIQPIATGLNTPPVMARRGPVWKAAISIVTGVGLIFGSGLELSRMTLPYDPWYEEANHYRKVATKQGDKPSAWFGAYKYYRPMDLNTWINKVGDWIKNVEKEIEDPNHMSNVTLELGKNSNVIVSNQESGGILSKLNNKGKYQEIYNKLRESNTNRTKQLLESELKDVYESNKGQRLAAILDGTSPLQDPEYSKPSIQLGSHKLETDDDLEMVWLNFEPWDELKLETDYDIRLIPRCSVAGKPTESLETTTTTTSRSVSSPGDDENTLTSS
ncbi:Mitochondrial inner membrane i-AAA protease complex subunit MGR1 [Spathaspora sp. JA1]|nr:Mitochondrial inner membrane i-AAA protease complex subunit MGR1 [Spathaspora sp. JA1]